MKKKGINLAHNDLKNGIISLINDSGLPYVNLNCILREIGEQLSAYERQAIERERTEYNSSEEGETTDD